MSKLENQSHSPRTARGPVRSYDEVGSILGISATTVAKIEKEAFKKLRNSKYFEDVTKR